MPKYLVEGRYTSDGLKGLAREGGSRRRVDIAKTIESAGGKLEAIYFAFGDADFYIIFDVPDNISAAALSMVANQSRFVTSKIIVLMTADEVNQAIKKTKTRVSAAGTLTCPRPRGNRRPSCSLATRAADCAIFQPVRQMFKRAHEIRSRVTRREGL